MSIRRNKQLAAQVQAPVPEERQAAKIAIALVSHDMVPFRFAADLGALMAHTVACMPDEVEVRINTIQGTYVHTARQEMMMQLVAAGVTHILWIDTDMSFPPDALVRLLHHQKYVVGINYAKRTLDPPSFVALKEVGGDEEYGRFLRTFEEDTGLEEVEGLGFGMTLMRTVIAGALPHPSEGPWFGHEWLPKRRNWVGEDIYFCNLLRAAGVPMYVDHDLSKEVGHIGQFIYRTQHVEEAFNRGLAAPEPADQAKEAAS